MVVALDICFHVDAGCLSFLAAFNKKQSRASAIWRKDCFVAPFPQLTCSDGPAGYCIWQGWNG
jgi:hypothetical protein